MAYQTAPNGFNPYFNNGMMAQQQAPSASSWLTADEQETLRKTGPGFSLQVTPEEVLAAQCNHCYSNGDSATIANDEGGYTCQICGTKFKSEEYAKEEVAGVTEAMLDMLNTIKVMYVSLPADSAREFFQVIAFIKKIPQLYEVALNDFKRYEGSSGMNSGANPNIFGLFNAMINPGFGGMPYGMPQQPMYQQPVNPMVNPIYQQQPMYGMPQAGYQAQPQGYAMNPQGAAAPAPVYNTNMPVQPAAQPAAPAPAVGAAPVVGVELKK